MKIKPKVQRRASAPEPRTTEGATKERPRLEGQQRRLPGTRPQPRDMFKQQGSGVDAALGSARLGSTAATSAKMPPVQSMSAASFDPGKLSSQLQQGFKGLTQIDLGKVGLKPQSPTGDSKSWVTVEGQDADGNFQLRDLNTQESYKLSADQLRKSMVGGVVTVGPIRGELTPTQQAHLTHDLFRNLRGLGFSAADSIHASRGMVNQMCSYNPGRLGGGGWFHSQEN